MNGDNVQENIQRLNGQFQIIKAKRRRLYVKEQSVNMNQPQRPDGVGTCKEDTLTNQRLLPSRECKRAALMKIREQNIPFPKGAFQTQ
jgi:hypothetical protein